MSVCVAAVMCAGSVGWAFVQQQRTAQRKQQPPMPPAVLATPTPSPTYGGAESWGGRQVTLPMLAAALERVGVPDALYSLPGIHEATSGSHYFLAPGARGWRAGVAEGGDERNGPRFTTEDAACRWLYNELNFAEPPAVRLSPSDEDGARRRAGTVRDRVDAALHPRTIVPEPRPSQPPTPKATKKPKPPPISVVITLLRGFVVDQYGQESGFVLFPYGVAPNGPVERTEAHRFRVARAFPVRASDGGRLGVESSLFSKRPSLPTVRWLLHNGYLRRVANS